uniref:Uncharacterized protein n=1 Tax=Nothoprocta perdicaria TaxID=30464 RepID=A0A8C7EGQ3_NOTPE
MSGALCLVLAPQYQRDEELMEQNSPLYQYLQDLGHTDFEVCSAVSQKAEPCAAGGGQQEWTTRAAQQHRLKYFSVLI